MHINKLVLRSKIIFLVNKIKDHGSKAGTREKGKFATSFTHSASVSGDITNVLSKSQDGPVSHAASLALENKAVVQPVAVTQMHGDHFQYSGPWFSTVPSHTVFASSGP